MLAPPTEPTQTRHARPTLAAHSNPPPQELLPPSLVFRLSLSLSLFADIVGRIGIFTLNGNQENSQMLQAVVSKETLADTLVMIVVDLSRPWTIPDSLARWSHVLVGDDFPAQVPSHFPFL